MWHNNKKYTTLGFTDPGKLAKKYKKVPKITSNKIFQFKNITKSNSALLCLIYSFLVMIRNAKNESLENDRKLLVII